MRGRLEFDIPDSRTCWPPTTLKVAITPMIFKAVQIQLVDYQSFLWFKIQCAISISTVERASQMQCAHQEMEWTLQQIEHQ